MKPFLVTLLAAAAILPAQALYCECGQSKDGRWSYSRDMTINTCNEVGGKMKQNKYPECKFFGCETTWEEECKKQDTVGNSADGYCEDKKKKDKKKKKKNPYFD
ncbi:hypothetical protein LZ30DRAFT_694156 [Colletotrichum cereale]|nr:hypothetical protein LZ30DRAFT_694156 [Colletotrichum cereale]